MACSCISSSRCLICWVFISSQDEREISSTIPLFLLAIQEDDRKPIALEKSHNLSCQLLHKEVPPKHRAFESIYVTLFSFRGDSGQLSWTALAWNLPWGWDPGVGRSSVTRKPSGGRGTSFQDVFLVGQARGRCWQGTSVPHCMGISEGCGSLLTTQLTSPGESNPWKGKAGATFPGGISLQATQAISATSCWLCRSALLGIGGGIARARAPEDEFLGDTWRPLPPHSAWRS